MLHRRDVVLTAGTAGLLGLGKAIPTGGAGEIAGGGAANVADLGRLRAAAPSSVVMVYDGAVFRWTAGDFTRPPLGPADDLNIVKQNDTPLTSGAWVRRSQLLSVKAFGAVDGLLASPAENTRAFQQAVATAATLGLPLHLDGGVYLLDANGQPSGGVNFARAGLHIKGDGAVLRFRGRGQAFVLDQGGRSGGFIEGISVEGITIVGGDGVTDGFYSRGVVRSAFRDIQVLDVAGKAFWIRHAVSCHFDNLKYSAWPAGQSKPAILAKYGLYLDNNDAAADRGYYTAGCVFTNPVMESFPGIGCQLQDASGNLFLGGTFEGCDTGLVIGRASNNNSFIKIWMEANTVADAIVAGNGNGFAGGTFVSVPPEPNVRILAGAGGTWFADGGYLRAIHLAAGSLGTTFSHIGVDENRGGAIGFQGSGPFTRVNCKKIGGSNNITGAYEDVVGSVEAVGDSGTWSPVLKSGRGAITQNAAQSQGSWQRIGKLVFAHCVIQVDAVAAPAGRLSISGLPYRSAMRQPGSVHAERLRPSAAPLQAHVDQGGAVLWLSRPSTTDVAPDLAAGASLAVTISYTAAS